MKVIETTWPIERQFSVNVTGYELEEFRIALNYMLGKDHTSSLRRERVIEMVAEINRVLK